MDTTPLEQKIQALEAEIAEDQKKIDLLKQNISTNKSALKIYQKGLERIKGQEKWETTYTTRTTAMSL